MRRYLTYFAAFEVIMFAIGFCFDINVAKVVFILVMVFFPLVVSSMWYKTLRREDEVFESPTLWVALAILGMLGSAVLVTVGIYAFTQGGVEDAAEMWTYGAIGITCTVLMTKRAMKRKTEWRRIVQARKVFCPACGFRVRDAYSICHRCGAIVFWVPTWTPANRGRDAVTLSVNGDLVRIIHRY